MASTGVNVKMGVSGIAQFKQNISTAKNSLKTLDAQLALNEKQFKATGDSEAYMQEKSELLKVKLEEQKSIVSNAEKALKDMTERGVDKASKAYQDMQQQLLKAKGDLLDTEQQMQGVAEAGDNAGDAVSEMNAQMKRIGDGVNFQNVTDGLDKITSGMEAVIKKAVNVGKAIVKDVLGAGSWADDLHTRAKYYGLSDEDLQRMEKTATLIDTPVEAIISAQKKLRKGLGSKEQGVMGAFAAMFGEGYDVDAAGWEKAFWDAGQAIMNFTDEEEKEVYAQKLFGRSWNELIPLFEAGKKEYDEMNASWSVVSDENLKSLQEMDDQYQRMNNELETVKRQLEAAFSPAITQVLEILTGLLEEFNKYLDSDEGKRAMQDLSDALTGWAEKLKNINISDIIHTVEEGFTWITDHSTEIVKAVEGIALAFVALKTAAFALNIARVVSGFKGLLGGKGTGAETGAEATGTASAGGALTGAKNAITYATSKANALITGSGLQNMLPAVGDWIMNQTNFGRALRDGTDVLEGVKQDLEETREAIEQNAETFDEDWKDFAENNPIAQTIQKTGELMQIAGNNTYGDEMTAEEAMALALAQEEAAKDLQGNSEVQKHVSEALSRATDRINGLPGIIEDAIITAMSGIRIEIDGQTAGQVLTPYISAGMGGFVMAMEK